MDEVGLLMAANKMLLSSRTQTPSEETAAGSSFSCDSQQMGERVTYYAWTRAAPYVNNNWSLTLSPEHHLTGVFCFPPNNLHINADLCGEGLALGSEWVSLATRPHSGTSYYFSLECCEVINQK